jgi:hypothetical protein
MTSQENSSPHFGQNILVLLSFDAARQRFSCRLAPPIDARFSPNRGVRRSPHLDGLSWTVAELSRTEEQNQNTDSDAAGTS